MDLPERVAVLLEVSPAAHRIARGSSSIYACLNANHRRIWPFARAARLLGISETLLRQWIGAGLVLRARLPSPYRPGVTERSLRNFLTALAKEWEEGWHEVCKNRRCPAEERCRATARALPLKEALTTRHFAAKAGVSVSTVRRLAALRVIREVRPTLRRIRICRWTAKISKKSLDTRNG